MTTVWATARINVATAAVTCHDEGVLRTSSTMSWGISSTVHPMTACSVHSTIDLRLTWCRGARSCNLTPQLCPKHARQRALGAQVVGFGRSFSGPGRVGRNEVVVTGVGRGRAG